MDGHAAEIQEQLLNLWKDIQYAQPIAEKLRSEQAVTGRKVYILFHKESLPTPTSSFSSTCAVTPSLSRS